MAAAPVLSERERIEKAREYVMEGYATCGHIVPTVAGMAGYFGVGRPRIKAWAEQDEDFAEVVEGMMAVQESLLVAGGLSKIMDSQVVRLMLSRHGYHPQATIEHTGSMKSEHSIDPSKLSPEALQELVALRVGIHSAN